MGISQDINQSAPLISIGVPVYNGDLYIRECLDSLVEQTYQNWECVIIDNCSTDNTNAIAREFTERDSRFRLIRNEEFLDLMPNWNESYKHISGNAKYFKVIPADDWIMPNYLTEMVKLMEENPSVGLCSSYRIDGTRVRGNGLDIYREIGRAHV